MEIRVIEVENTLLEIENRLGELKIVVADFRKSSKLNKRLGIILEFVKIHPFKEAN